MDAELIGMGEDDFNNSKVMEAFDGDEIFPEPQIGMEFDSDHAAKLFYEGYARNFGFSTRAHGNRLDANGMATTSWDYFCSLESLKKRPIETCKAMLRIEVRGENKWFVTKFVKEHNHTVNYHNKRHFMATKDNVAGIFGDKEGVRRGMMYVSVDGNSRRRTLGSDAQNLLDYFKKMQTENPGFYYAIQLDEENRMANAFWADMRSRTAYGHFGDAVTLETKYIKNQYSVPIALFTGVNHHCQRILFGCALLLDESIAAFVWLFKTFLSAMDDHAPISLTTDKDKNITAAVVQVFPDVRHRFDKWDVLTKGQERMAHLCHMHPNFQVELYNCINMTETIEEFESFWESILDTYDLKENEWLRSIYDTRSEWMPVYFRDSFFGSPFPSLGYESSFLDGYINQQTTLPVFFRQYERALENSFMKEVESDFDTLRTASVLKTHSPMEKQAADLYTKRIFSKFQEELVETFVYTANRINGDGNISTYRVAKFGDNYKAYSILLNTAEMKANCSCKMFEHSGILCRHVLTVFTVTNVLTLPSHCILKRWTMDAKISSIDKGHESPAARYNYLCKEAIRFAEEGAITPETYSAALFSLIEAGRKVAEVKRSVAKVAPSSSQISGVGCHDRRSSTANPEMTPLLWPQPDEITIQRFNRGSAGVPSQLIGNSFVPHLAPVSCHDADQKDKTGVLPCLKSMTWVMENKNSTPANRVAVISLKLQAYSRTPAGESEVKFSLSRVSLDPILRSMTHINDQLSTPANKVAVVNLKLQDTETSLGESDLKFQVSRDTLGAMLRSMAYIREQLSNRMEARQENSGKKLRH